MTFPPDERAASESGGTVIYIKEWLLMASSHGDAQTKTDKDRSAQDERSEARQELDRWQDDSDKRRREVRNDARREARHGALAAQDAVRSYVRANNRLVTLLIPPGFQRPGELLRSTFDMWAQIFQTQRAIVDEMVMAYRDNLRYADREAERDERVSRDEAFGYYDEDRQFEQRLHDDDREDRDEQRERRQSRRAG